MTFRASIATFAAVGSMFGMASPAFALNRVEPAVIDVTTMPRETPGFTVSVVNEGAGSVTYYPLVGEFDPVTGTVDIPGSPYEADRLVSANLEINREELTVPARGSRPLTGKVNVSSKLPPGVYHAVVAFVSEFPEGGQRDVRLDPMTPRALLNITVSSDAKERLNLVTFDPLRKIFVGFPARLTVRLENGGNVPLTPGIRTQVFDRADRERGSTATEVPGGAIAAGAALDIPVAVSGQGYGRYRALIGVSYGAGSTGQLLTASASFWVLPLWLLALLAGLLLMLSYGAARVIVRSGHRSHDA